MYKVMLIAILLGVLSGLIPGIHPNLVASIMSASGIGAGNMLLLLSVMLGIAVALSFYPSIFLGMPDDPSYISLLPGHRLYNEGKGLVALRQIGITISVTIILALIFIPLAIFSYPYLYGLIAPYMGFVLIIILIFMMAQEKNLFATVIICLLAGGLGYFTLDNSPEPLLVLFSGFFAMSSVYLSWHSIDKNVSQDKPEPAQKPDFKTCGLGVFGGYLAGLIPAITSPAQMALLFSPLLQKKPIKYLEFISSMVVAYTLFAYATSLAINKPRIGVLAYVGQIDSSNITLGVMGLAFGLAIGILLLEVLIKLTERFKPNLNTFTLGVGIYLPILVYMLAGGWGLLLFACASALGVAAVLLGVKRIFLMGSLVIPLILYYLI